MSDTITIQSFKFGSKEINYELTYQERKTLGIRVYPDCKVRVIAPNETTEEKLKSKLREKAPWIIKQQLEFLSYHPLTPPRQYVNGETHLYLGRQYKLRIENDLQNGVKVYRGRLILFKKENTSPANILTEWYREKAALHFHDILNKVLPLFKRYGISTPDLQIRYMPTRWGSCTVRGKVILNPDLIKAPKGSIEYVIIHELCHLVHHNHTKAFYDLQETIMPDWKKWKERLENTLN
ncbi:SprT family zinc-dependent metalloprotease [Marivirga atlantica]|jgi:predicted metal-dependent hydrolase|uniref:M48 family metallopeptidase n=1 Tax=Marivirga atlantica TaxID=1548457 RepID=A0A937DJG8_9BACT|nr:SprT family zinc-dependent metalloprotease [Marivirga atlantica]MBL0765980.1 M48 family metallopeptidase [Marivirga atlantica]